MDKSTFVGGTPKSKSSGEVPVPLWRKKSKNRSIEEVKKKLFTLPILPFLQGTIVQGQEKPPQPTMSPTGESESIVSVCLPQLCRMLPKRPTTFSPDPEHQSWIVWDSKEQGKRVGPKELGHETQQRAMVCTNCLRESTKKSTHEPPRMHHLQFHTDRLCAPPVFCVFLPLPPVVNTPCMPHRGHLCWPYSAKLKENT